MKPIRKSLKKFIADYNPLVKDFDDVLATIDDVYIEFGRTHNTLREYVIDLVNRPDYKWEDYKGHFGGK